MRDLPTGDHVSSSSSDTMASEIVENVEIDSIEHTATTSRGELRQFVDVGVYAKLAAFADNARFTIERRLGEQLCAVENSNASNR